ncbi:putative ribosomal protein L6 [Toxoplasma gondii CAST]|nr:putative ribosomal protein L6 [Toxoplasma gondii CAST]
MKTFKIISNIYKKNYISYF